MIGFGQEREAEGHDGDCGSEDEVQRDPFGDNCFADGTTV